MNHMVNIPKLLSIYFIEHIDDCSYHKDYEIADKSLSRQSTN